VYASSERENVRSVPYGMLLRSRWAYAMVGSWVAIPPLWFLWEYIHFRPPEGIKDERMRHLHDLCRNIGLALVVILVAIVGIPWPVAP
jgi:hypothetical protein